MRAGLVLSFLLAVFTAAGYAENLPKGPLVGGITPLTLLWLASQSQSSSSSDSTTPQPSPGGSLYWGSAEENREWLLGISLYSDFFDLSFQNRTYLSHRNSGLFAGSFVSVEVLRFQYYEDPKQGMSLTNDQSKGLGYLLIGTRLGGNVGMRMSLGQWGFTPRVGLTLPLFYLSNSFPFDNDKMLRFYGLNALMRLFEIGLTVDWGVQSE